MKPEPTRWLDTDPRLGDDQADMQLRALMRAGAEDVAPRAVLERTAQRLEAALGVKVDGEVGQRTVSQAGEATAQLLRAKSGWLLALKGIGAALLLAGTVAGVQRIGTTTAHEKAKQARTVEPTAREGASVPSRSGEPSQRAVAPSHASAASVSARPELAPVASAEGAAAEPNDAPRDRAPSSRSIAKVVGRKVAVGARAPAELEPAASVRASAGAADEAHLPAKARQSARIASANRGKIAVSEVAAASRRTEPIALEVGRAHVSAAQAEAIESDTEARAVAAPSEIAPASDFVAEARAPDAQRLGRAADPQAQRASVAAKGANPTPTQQATRLEELRALEAAQRDLRYHPGRALVALQAHAERFPSSWLAQERDALTIRALLGVRERSKARAALKAFVARYPESALLDELQQAANAP